MNIPSYFTTSNPPSPLTKTPSPTVTSDHIISPTSLRLLAEQQLAGHRKLAHQSQRDPTTMYQTYIPTNPPVAESTPPQLFNRYG